ncbi:FAD-dependent oxidoreductase [Halanaerobium sp. ST460_2HS_T2]|uniref:FAD-dependent oxidoreductase n=1 Tax=Halanaerobium sp. ST460_2HS_T2 TaxID=2183914 RepID=UPI000DF23B49|nr:FAD-dependent oxidoreductase [Halanaerobium sp. ST460_2HS_T2]RCW52143.1 NADH dehydrogenase/NADH oxidase (H2O2-forming) [Halanaerobium sp. ST460_2HS_T2]
MKNYDLLIIGGGPAGITLTKNIKNKRDIGIMRPEDHSMIYCAMPYVIEDLLPYEKTLKTDSIVTDTGADLIRDLAVDINFENKTVKTAKGDQYDYNELIIATGADPILPPIAGAELDGVMTFKSEDDLKKILDTVNSGVENVSVVGAGAIGIELAQALNEKGIKTNLIDMMPTVLPNMLDPEIAEAAEKELKELGINLYLDQRVVELKGDSALEAVMLDNEEEIASELVVFAVGMKPNVDFLKDSDLEIAADGILVNDKMETNIEDVYAAGDCVQFESGITDEVISGKLATNAVAMGRVLAANLLDGDRSYKGFYNGAATKVGKFYVGGTGLTEKLAAEKYEIVTAQSEFKTAFPIMPFAKDVKLKLIVNKADRRVLGGQIISGEPVTDKVDKITMTVQYGLNVDQLLDFNYSAQPYQSFYPAHNLLVKAAEEAVKKLDS